MKKLLYIGVFCGLALHVRAQDNTDTVSLPDLTPPAAPAFSLLDVAPTTIDRPGTVRAFAVSIANAIGNSSNGFPRNFAIQVAPYWLFAHPDMDIYKYNGLVMKSGPEPKGRLEFKQNIFYGLRNFSFSAASVNTDSTQSNPYMQNYIAYSLKANVINVRKRRVLEAMRESIAIINAGLGKVVDSASTYCANLYDPAVDTLAAKYRDCIQNVYFWDSVTINGQRRRYDSILAVRPLLSVDVALASSMAFANNNFNDNHLYRSGGWVTACLSEPLDKYSATNLSALYNAKNYVNIYGMFRVLSEENTTDFKTFTTQTNIDFGGRLEFEFSSLAISFESVYRKVANHQELNTSRNVGIIQYKLSSNLVLTGTFGKNYGTTNNLVSFLGLNWGFGKTGLYNKLSYQ